MDPVVNSRRARNGVAALAAAAALVIFVPGAATAAPVVSQASGRLLEVELLDSSIAAILDLAAAEAVNPDGSSPNVISNVPLDATALSILNLQIAPGINLFGDNGIIRLGAVGQYAEARADSSSVAFAGTVSAAPSLLGIGVSPDGSNLGTPGAGDSASIVVGTGTLLGGLDLVNLNIGIGAVAASAQQPAGSALPSGDYTIADLSIGVGGTLLSGILSTLAGPLDSILALLAPLGIVIANPITPAGTIEITLDDLLAVAGVDSLQELPEGTNLLTYLGPALVTKITSIVNGLLTSITGLLAGIPVVGPLTQGLVNGILNTVLNPLLNGLTDVLAGPIGTAVDAIAQLNVNNQTTNPDGSFTQNALTIGLGINGSLAEVRLANATVGPNAGIDGVPVANADSLLIAGGIVGLAALGTGGFFLIRRRQQLAPTAV